MAAAQPSCVSSSTLTGQDDDRASIDGMDVLCRGARGLLTSTYNTTTHVTLIHYRRTGGITCVLWFSQVRGVKIIQKQSTRMDVGHPRPASRAISRLHDLSGTNLAASPGEIQAPLLGKYAPSSELDGMYARCSMYARRAPRGGCKGGQAYN